ncbi:MAG: hypothetical protein ACYCY2_09635 [Acidithiobacillus ferriphilus]|uniref:hypothetical protein n=1 Tax=Acidithiobacillus ferriphilus TaxID=1689834 RepID=UPI001C0651FB|nr:hypothetical protein [Acidithiobacillus ferriphilus]MBU2827884.1 hypothetical protein [Acidithiobacillus ferriphilus]MBU2830320.1 hypothetical protein [Acidithiobacillus ferriphilus]MBU2846350.1 hypothetical protein [Acidithiobacillus ferriphilus]MBW9249965.1 hypothetical protein [Acidithiobacillus ferriphilus]MBW9255502.1 hypothetical protein [Acidithiobacillus ferriphilus]
MFRRVLIRSGILIIFPLIIGQFAGRNNADGFALDLNGLPWHGDLLTVDAENNLKTSVPISRDLSGTDGGQGLLCQAGSQQDVDMGGFLRCVALSAEGFRLGGEPAFTNDGLPADHVIIWS